MGGTFSCGVDNDDLVDKLVQANYIRSQCVEAVFRGVDRGDYVIYKDKHHAYRDSAWQYDKLHLSAPCIYSDVMEALELRSGLSFLNLGSGTGYLSTMIGLILGTYGVNHGIEIHEELVVYAEEKLKKFLDSSLTLEEFDFCIPKFNIGNCLSLPESYPKYDRVYCGASCSKKYENHMKRLLKIGGLLVMPYRDKLVQVKRLSETNWRTRELHNVNFTNLIPPTREHMDNPPEQADFLPPTLQRICRDLIRNILRQSVFSDQPALTKNLKASSNNSKEAISPNEFTAIRIPLDSDLDDLDFNRYHNLDEQSGSREVNALLSLVYNMRTNRIAERFNEQSDLVANPLLAALNRDDDSQSSDSSISVELLTEDENDSEQSDESQILNNAVDVNVEDASESNSASQPESVQDADDAPIETEASSSNNDSSSKSKKREKFDSGIGEDISSNNKEDPRHIDSDSSSDEEYTPKRLNSKRENTESRIKHQRKRFHSDGDEYDDSGASPETAPTSESVQNKKVQKLMKNSNFHNERRETISKCMKLKVSQLPLPPPLKHYINFNRDF